MAKKKIKTSNARKPKFVEEKHIGYETTEWVNLDPIEFEKKFRETLDHYRYFYDQKDTKKWGNEWVKKNRPANQYKAFQSAPDWMFSRTVGAICKMMLNGATFTGARMTMVNDEVDQVISRIDNKPKETKSASTRKSPADLVKEKTSEFIADVEDVLDMFGENFYIDWDNYSVYNELTTNDYPYNTAKAVVDYYTPLRDELQELVTNKTDDLVEAYSRFSVRQRKTYLKVVEGIIEDAEKYMLRKKATRKPRKKKVASVGAQTSKLKYMPESAEYKITSVDPTNIVGAKEVYLFNTKYRNLAHLITSATKGFEVKGTTIQNVDSEASYQKKIRKPEEFFTEFQKATKAKARKLLKDLKTKEGKANGRVNEQTLIVKVY